MEKQGRPSPFIGALLFFEQLEVLSFEENLLIANSSKRLKVEARYRLKMPLEKGGMMVSCRVSACELIIRRDDQGNQVPLYKTALELLEENGTDDTVVQVIQSCLAGAP